MKIDRHMLTQMYRAALSDYKDKTKSPHESDEQFLARCWCEAFIGILKGEGYEVAVLDSGTPLPDGVESIGITKDRV